MITPIVFVIMITPMIYDFTDFEKFLIQKQSVKSIVIGEILS